MLNMYSVKYEDHEDRASRVWAWTASILDAKDIAASLNNTKSWRGRFYAYDPMTGERFYEGA